LQSDDVTEEIILVVKKLTQRKAFLDRLAIPVESGDFRDYLELYKAPNELRDALENKFDEL